MHGALLGMQFSVTSDARLLLGCPRLRALAPPMRRATYTHVMARRHELVLRSMRGVAVSCRAPAHHALATEFVTQCMQLT